MKKQSSKSRKGLRAVSGTFSAMSQKELHDTYGAVIPLGMRDRFAAEISFRVMLDFMDKNNLLKNFLAITLREWSDILTKHAPKKGKR